MPIPPGYTGKVAVAAVLFNRAEQEGRIVFDFGLLGESFEGSDAEIFDVIKNNSGGDTIGNYTSGQITGHGCEFIMVIFQSARNHRILKTDDAPVSSRGVAGFHVDIETCSSSNL